MSSTFSFSRLGKLIKKQFHENSRLYGFSVLALFGILAIIFTFWIIADAPIYREEATLILFVLGLYGTGTIFTSFSFSMLGSRDKGIYWLSIPATHAEKLICAILYSTVLFFIIYCSCYYAVKSVAISYLEDYVNARPGYSYTEMKESDTEFGTVFKYFIYGYFVVQAIYLLGSVYFSRYSFVVTTVVGAFIVFTFMYYMSSIHERMFNPHQWDLLTVKKTDASINDGYMLYSISPAIADTFSSILKFALAPLFWFITWLRLKEKEI